MGQQGTVGAVESMGGSRELWGPWETVDEDSYSLKVMEVYQHCTPKAGAFSLLL